MDVQPCPFDCTAHTAPGTGWVFHAFGSKRLAMASFMWSWFSTLVDAVIYPNLIVNYASSVIPGLREQRRVANLGMMGLLCLLSLLGVRGTSDLTAFFLTFTLLPFAIFCVACFMVAEPSNVLEVLPLEQINWSMLVQTTFWNCAYFDSGGFVAGGVVNPMKTFPAAMWRTLLLVLVVALVPLSAAIMASDWTTWAASADDDDSATTQGPYSVVAQQVGGKWLSWLIVGSVMLSCPAQFLSDLTAASNEVSALADFGLMPRPLLKRAFGAPWVATLLCSSVLFALVLMTYEELIEVLNLIYILSAGLNMLALVRQRWLGRRSPYMIPMGTCGVSLMALVWIGTAGTLFAWASARALYLTAGFVVGGVFFIDGAPSHPLLPPVRRRAHPHSPQPCTSYDGAGRAGSSATRAWPFHEPSRMHITHTIHAINRRHAGATGHGGWSVIAAATGPPGTHRWYGRSRQCARTGGHGPRAAARCTSPPCTLEQP